VPRHILVNSHGQLAKDETIKKIIPQAYHDGIKEQQLDPIDLPEITEVDLKDGVLTLRPPWISVLLLRSVNINRSMSSAKERSHRRRSIKDPGILQKRPLRPGSYH